MKTTRALHAVPPSPRDCERSEGEDVQASVSDTRSAILSCGAWDSRGGREGGTTRGGGEAEACLELEGELGPRWEGGVGGRWEVGGRWGSGRGGGKVEPGGEERRAWSRVCSRAPHRP